MIDDAFKRGHAAALARFKLSNMQMGAAGYNPTLNGQASAAQGTSPAVSPPSMTPPSNPAAPGAAGAAKSKVLG